MTTLDQYREAKTNYIKLKTQAKKELLARFHELANELLQVQRELLEDFGEKVAMPAKGKKPVKAAKKTAAEPAPAEKPDPKVEQLKKQLEAQRKKLETAKEQNKPTRAIEDRIYEIEDSLRLAQEG